MASGKTCVLHWDDNPTNNVASNLLDTENVNDRKEITEQLPNFIDGRSKRSVRNTESCGNPILEPHQVRMIRKPVNAQAHGLRSKLAKLWGFTLQQSLQLDLKAWAEPHKLTKSHDADLSLQPRPHLLR